VLGLQNRFRALGARDLHLVSGQQPAVALKPRDSVGPEKRRDAAGHGLDDGRPPLLHGGEIEFQIADPDAVNGEFILGPLVEFEDSSKAFDGMQPAFRQVPPNAYVPSEFFHSSMHATFSLFWAARMAAG